MELSVSVIIPAYNAEKTIGMCLDSLLGLEYSKELLELIVVDNDSTDSTREIVSRYPVKLCIESRHTSYAARNRGIEEAGGDICAFTDSDCLVDRNWLLTGINELKTKKLDVLGGRILAYKPETRIEKYLHHMGSVSSEKSFERNKYIPTANMIAKRSVIVDLNGFNENLISGGDLDFSWRCLLHDYKVGYSQETIVYHMHRTKLLDFYGQYFKYGYGKYFLNKQYSFLDAKDGGLSQVYSAFLKKKVNRSSGFGAIFLGALVDFIKIDGDEKYFKYFNLIRTIALRTGRVYARFTSRRKKSHGEKGE